LKLQKSESKANHFQGFQLEYLGDKSPVKESQEVREILEDRSNEQLQSLIDELDEKIVDRKPISNQMLQRCRKKAVAQSILDDRQPEPVAHSHTKPRGQQGLEAFS